MSNGKRVSIDNIGAEIVGQLSQYREDIQNRVNLHSEQAAKRLVELTKATAPVGKRRRHYRANIAYTENRKNFGAKFFTWYVKGKDYRLTHLLVHGHATRTGGRTKANPFLHNARDAVIDDYEKAVEEEIRNG